MIFRKKFLKRAFARFILQLLKYGRTEFIIKDKLGCGKEEKQILFQNKKGFDRVDNGTVISLHAFGQVQIEIVPSH